MATNKKYNVSHFLAFNFSGLACIAIAVFLSSTQPFYLSEVIGINKDEKIGSIIGTLGFVDEIVSIISSPLIGTLNDKFNNMRIKARGSKIIQLVSFLLITLALIGYSQLANVVIPDLLIFRSIFAIGVTGCMNMVTVMLNELTSSDFTFKKFLCRKKNNADNDSGFNDGESEIQSEIQIDKIQTKKNGIYSALIGLSSGIGAIFSVAVFLSLPVNISNFYPDLSFKTCLKITYLIIAIFALIVSLILYFFLYNANRSRSYEKVSYFILLKQGFKLSKKKSEIHLAYIGSFVARSATVTTSVFIPLLVYNYYSKIGFCNQIDDMNLKAASKNNCLKGFVFAATLTGVAQAFSLLISPLWGLLINTHLGSYKTLFLSSFIGLIGNFGICISGLNQDIFNPKTISCFIMVSFIGVSQMGVIISSMSLLTGLKSEDPNMGSLSGLYSLCGGIGVLIITKLGGFWSDHWILSPFCLLGLFNILLFCYSLAIFILKIKENKNFLEEGMFLNTPETIT